MKRLPQHVAISADGNGRWATNRGLPRTAGHKASERAFKEVLYGVRDLKIPYLSLHVFSTENWNRSPAETANIFALFIDVLHRSLMLFTELGVRFRWTGEREELPPDLISKLSGVEAATAQNSSLTLQFCANYGGKAEITHAAVALARGATAGKIDLDSVDESAFSAFMYRPDIPDVDLFIRTAGEHRFSNFLLWQSAYAEIHFVDTLWPDFSRQDLWRAIALYAGTDRRFGATKD